MKVENGNGEWLFVAETNDENNAVASLITLLVSSNCNISDNEANNHGHAWDGEVARNYVYIPSWESLEGFDTAEGTEKEFIEIMYNKRPHWSPAGNRISIRLTTEQLNYIRPVFNLNKTTEVGGVMLHGCSISGIRTAIKTFIRRFEYSDIDMSNITPYLN